RPWTAQRNPMRTLFLLGALIGWSLCLTPRALAQGGVPLWTNRYNGPANYEDRASGMAVDGAGNAFVTGYSARTNASPFNRDYATIKYSSAGVPLWTNRYNGPGNATDQATAVAVDGQGNAFVTGFSTASDTDYATIKYSSAGE